MTEVSNKLPMKKNLPMRVYVAGAYTPTSKTQNHAMEVFENMKRGIEASAILFSKGYAPFCPWLDFHFTLCRPKEAYYTTEMFYDYSLSYMVTCEAVLVVPGWESSIGTKVEIALAEAMSIPVFFGMESLFRWAESRNDDVNQPELPFHQRKEDIAWGAR